MRTSSRSFSSGNDYLREPGLQKSLAQPQQKGAPQFRLRRFGQPLYQGGQHGVNRLGTLAVLQAEQGGDQVAHPRQFRVGIGVFVDEQVAQPGAVDLQAGRTGFDQVGQVGGGGPAPPAIIEDDGQHQRQAAAAPELPAPDQVLVEQIEISGQPGGHEGMDAGLEFEQDVDVEPVRPPAQPPDDIVAALPQPVVDEFGGILFQSGKVEVADPVLANEAD